MAAAFAPPLAGIKAVSLASLGPGPYAAMLLADLGCDVVIVDRTAPMVSTVAADKDPRRRGQRSIALDLKNAEARQKNWASRLIAALLSTHG
jgi:alpha-methylacyl-CoA racemase